MATVALAAISARVLAQAAAREGFGAVALDLFGDRDTCHAASAWLRIGWPGELRIVDALLLDALEALARRGDVMGWVAGAGFEGRAELLAQGAARLPLFGTQAAELRRVRDPATFFGFLKACGFAYPPVRHDRGGESPGWLLKDAGGCGGGHIVRAAERAAAAPAPAASLYLQREVAGVPMSATYIANGRDAVVLGFNEQIVRPLGGRPFVFSGVLGPVPVRDGVRREVTAVVRALSETFGLRGVGSLDFLLDGERVLVLEVNPRPSASLALYPRVGDGGVLRAHLHACRQGELPNAPPIEGIVHGHQIVVAPFALSIDDADAARLAARPNTHDLPRGALRFVAGDPVCSVSASGVSAESVKIELTRRCEALLRTLETLR